MLSRKAVEENRDARKEWILNLEKEIHGITTVIVSWVAIGKEVSWPQ
jgi:hypothetical protein